MPNLFTTNEGSAGSNIKYSNQVIIKYGLQLDTKLNHIDSLIHIGSNYMNCEVLPFKKIKTIVMDVIDCWHRLYHSSKA